MYIGLLYCSLNSVYFSHLLFISYPPILSDLEEEKRKEREKEKTEIM